MISFRKTGNQRWLLALIRVMSSLLLNSQTASSFTALPLARSIHFRLDALAYSVRGYASWEGDKNDFSSATASPSLLAFLDQRWSSSSAARLACAFAPAGHEIHPSDLTSAEVLAVDNHHIEISAVVCENESCVTVSVPVEFPHQCGYQDDLEECVLDNLQQLDDKAVQCIQQQEWNHVHTNDIQQEEHMWQSLSTEQQEVELPLWWIPPSQQFDDTMVRECQHIKDLLNENDFREDLVAMATRTCRELYPLDTFQMSRAVVALVGPAGIVVRAQLRLDGYSPEPVIVDLPVPFSQPVHTLEDLRAGVVRIVEA